jgi:hypothetical protein
MKKHDRFASASAIVVGAVITLATSLAHAGVDISADATAAKTDISTAGGVIIGVMVAVAVISWIRRVVH